MTLFAFDYLSVTVSSVKYTAVLIVNQAWSKRAFSVADTRVVFRLLPIDGGNNAATVSIFCFTYFVIEVVNRHLSFFN